MRNYITLLSGFVCLFAVLLDAFQTIHTACVRASGPVSGSRAIFYRLTWRLGLRDKKDLGFAQERIRLQLLRAYVADSSSGGVGGRDGNWLCG